MCSLNEINRLSSDRNRRPGSCRGCRESPDSRHFGRVIGTPLSRLKIYTTNPCRNGTVRKPPQLGFPHMLVGYMRVSTDGDRQVLDLQRDALLAAGVDERHLVRGSCQWQSG